MNNDQKNNDKEIGSTKGLMKINVLSIVHIVGRRINETNKNKKKCVNNIDVIS